MGNWEVGQNCLWTYPQFVLFYYIFIQARWLKANVLFAISYLAVAHNKYCIAWKYSFMGLLFPESVKTCISEIQSL